MNVEVTGIASKVREFFPTVAKAPLSGPDGMKTSYFGLFRMDSGVSVGAGSVSGRYTPHTSEDVVALCTAAENVFGEIGNVELGFRDGHYVSVTPSKQERLNVFDKGGDSVWPRLIIRAPYGGCFQADMGVYRDACRNLHIMRRVAGTSVRFRHTSSLRDKMDDLIADLGALQGGWASLTARMQQMEAARVNTAAFLDQLYPLAQDANDAVITRHRHRTEAIIRRIARERVAVGREASDLQTATAWELWNGIGGYLQHDKSRRGNPAGFDRAVLTFDDPVMEQAESLLLTMAV
jgi:hypothetical protein